MSFDDLPESLQRLDQVSIEELDLSEKTIAVLKWHGITSILTGILFFYHDAHHTSHKLDRLSPLMYAEVAPRMKAHGYWEVLLDGNVWEWLKQQDFYVGQKMVVFWQGRDQDLYEIPLDVLGLSHEAIENISWRFSLASVGDCVEHFVRNFSKSPKTRLSREKARDNTGASSNYLKFIISLFDEVQPKLIEHGYWRFVEEHVNTDYASDSDPILSDGPGDF